jgi:hypothetical protein
VPLWAGCERIVASMNTADRSVRATIFELLVQGAQEVTSADVADSSGHQRESVGQSFGRLADEHRIVLSDDRDQVVMAHPFSTLNTGYKAQIGGKSWLANCAWDAFAILALLGDGRVIANGPVRQETVWNVAEGVVEPDGFVHFVVPAAEFWDDIGFT